MSQQGILSDSTGPGADIETLTGDSGGAVGPDAAFNVTINGNPDIDVVGTPGTNTFQLTDLVKWTPYVVDSTVGAAPYSTVQSAIDAANAAGGNQLVLIRPGTYTEDLTFYTSLSIRGVDANVDTLAVRIIGSHTPPTDNATITFKNINFYGTTNIFFSAAAGEAYLGFDTCNFILSAAGYVFDMDNWVGPTGLVTGIAGIGLDNSGDLSTADSGTFKISNGTSGVVVLNSYVGSLLGGGTTPMIVKGTLQLSLSDVFCPVQLTDGTDTFIEQTNFHVDGITVSGASSGIITNCTFNNLTTAALTMSSTANWDFANNVVDSSNDPAIDGAGAGGLTISGIEFLDNANVSSSLALSTAATSRSQNTSLDNDHLKTSGSGSTVGAVTADLYTLAMSATASAYRFSVIISGYSAGSTNGYGYTIDGTVKTDGAAGSIVDVINRDADEDDTAAQGTIAVSGNNAIVRVTGVAGENINWKCIVEWVRAE